ncbi:MAG: S1 RNA-binding domain-containing protein, partial [Glaciimonas sp.]|nr:S1 RNA-binding domain-containing protein [Glaciimonas sp.]
GIHCSANERRADEASRDVEAWLKCYFIRDKLGEEFTGTISGVTTFGVFVQLDTLYIEGLVHVTELGADYFQYDESRHELRGERTGIRYQLTDRVTVQVSRVDLDARKIDLRLVTEPGIKTVLRNEARRADDAHAKSLNRKAKADTTPANRMPNKTAKTVKVTPSRTANIKAKSASKTAPALPAKAKKAKLAIKPEKKSREPQNFVKPTKSSKRRK